MLMKSRFKAVLIVLLTLGASIAASGQSKASREHCVIPIKPMTADVDVLYGDPEAAGEPFVMRISELPGTIIPPQQCPVGAPPQFFQALPE